MTLTRPQRRLLRYIAKWGDACSYAEEAVGCQGAAFDRVLDALYRRDLIRLGDDGVVIRITAAGDSALEEGRNK